MKFCKRPVVIDAEQFYPQNKPWPDGVEAYDQEITEPTGDGDYKFVSRKCWRIQTLEGWVNVSPGAWIITGVEGEMYPCKPSIFEKTYEAIK